MISASSVLCVDHISMNSTQVLWWPKTETVAQVCQSSRFRIGPMLTTARQPWDKTCRSNGQTFSIELLRPMPIPVQKLGEIVLSRAANSISIKVVEPPIQHQQVASPILPLVTSHSLIIIATTTRTCK